MPRNRLILLLVVALASGVAAGYLALTYLRTSEAPTVETETGTRPVVVASRDLDAGAILGPQDVETARFPEGSTPASYPASEDQVVGRGLLTAVSAGEPILLGKVATPEEGGGLSIVIPPGMRAVSVKVDEVIGVAGFVLPGTRVDVLATYDETGRNQDPTSKLVLQNVQALAIDQTTQRDAEGEPQTVSVITLLVDPEQAEVLALASNEGRIQLALRNGLDFEQVETRGVTLSGFGPAPPPARPTSTRRSPTVRRPTERTIVTYEGTTRKETEVPNEQ